MFTGLLISAPQSWPKISHRPLMFPFKIQLDSYKIYSKLLIVFEQDSRNDTVENFIIIHAVGTHKKRGFPFGSLPASHKPVIEMQIQFCGTFNKNFRQINSVR